MSLRVGDKAPEFTLCSYPSKGFAPVSLSALKGKTVVLAFYPATFSGSQSEGCEMQLCGLGSLLDLVDSTKVVFYAVSGDSPFSQEAFAKQLNLKYECLCDPSLKASEKFVGVLNLGQFLAEKGISDALGDFNASNRGCVIIGADQTIKYITSGNGNPMIQPDLSEIKKVLGIQE